MPDRFPSIPRPPPQRILLPIGRRTSVSDYEARVPRARTAQQASLGLPDTAVALHGFVVATGHTMQIGSLRTSTTWCADTMHANFNLRVRRIRLPAWTARNVPQSAIGIPAMLTKVCSRSGRSWTFPPKDAMGMCAVLSIISAPKDREMRVRHVRPHPLTSYTHLQVHARETTPATFARSLLRERQALMQ